jgi:YfiR/HmsC-like
MRAIWNIRPAAATKWRAASSSKPNGDSDAHVNAAWAKSLKMRGGRHLSPLVLAALMVAQAPARADDNLEYAVKAAYLTKFIPFIGWPEAALAGQPSFTICVIGADPFGAALDRAAAGQKAGERPLAVRRMAAFDPAASCPLLFLGAADAAPDVLAALKDKPVVTVTDSGVAAHGVISFVLADNHVRFDIDDMAASHGGISISSKLLELAHAVKRRETAP